MPASTRLIIVLLGLCATLTAQGIAARPLNFFGQIDVVFENSGGVYSAFDPADTFIGVIDDGTMGGSVGVGNITDGTTLTSFSCCTMAASGLSINNDAVVDQDFADLVNSLIGANVLSENDLVDIVDLEGDATTSSGGRIEVGLSWLLSPDTFPDDDIANYPFDPGQTILNVFFIAEEDEFGTNIFDAIGVVRGVPLPAAAWLFPAGLIAGLGWMRRRSAD